MDIRDNIPKKILSRHIVARALRVSLVVGSILVLINHHDALLSGNITSKLVIKILLTYLVPFSVSSYSSYRALQDARTID